ncbi:hypothetical protein PTKIN_Ptkin14bG0056200 [Pterospermum kingtungense]
MAKRLRVRKQVDRFSCLPDELLCHIISFLPIKDALRTCIISSRWNKVTPLMSSLDFDDCYVKKRSESRSFMKFVDRVLFYHHTGAVDRFRLKCRGFIDRDRVDGWILYALKNNVKDLDLWFSCKGFNMLPIQVLTSKSLVSLKLDIHYKRRFVLKLPVRVCFPSLKILHFSGIEIPDDDSIRRLVSSCCMLEELVVMICVLQRQCEFNVCSLTLKRLTINYTWRLYGDYGVKIKIDAPSLVYFKCYNLPQCFLLKNLNSLVRVDIHMGSLFDCGHSSVTYNAVATDLFRGISNVQTLRLSGTFGELLLKASSIVPKLPKLTCLDLDGDFMVGWERMLPYLLQCFPCLEALVLKVCHRFSGKSRRVKLPSKSFPSSLWSQLKTLKISSFEGKRTEMHMVKHFLDNVEVLENLSVQTEARDRTDPEKWRSRITKKLSNLPRVSEKCKVSINFL